MQGSNALLSLRFSVSYVLIMKSFFLQVAVVFFACGGVLAQEATKAAASDSIAEFMDRGVAVKGVRSPYYDDQGELQAILYGKQAKMLEGDVTDITGLRIDLYKDKKVNATLYAPQCLSHVVEKSGQSILVVESDGDVMVEMQGIIVVGRGFRFRSDRKRFEILNDARVMVDESVRESTEIDL